MEFSAIDAISPVGKQRKWNLLLAFTCVYIYKWNGFTGLIDFLFFSDADIRYGKRYLMSVDLWVHN